MNLTTTRRNCNKVHRFRTCIAEGRPLFDGVVLVDAYDAFLGAKRPWRRIEGKYRNYFEDRHRDVRVNYASLGYRAISKVPTVSIFAAMTGTHVNFRPDHFALIFRSNVTSLRLFRVDRLGLMSTSLKSNLMSSSMRGIFNRSRC